MLDDTLANERSSDALDRELEDLRYRITRIQEDLEYVSKGPRTTAKDEERRRLERELVRLMHEEVPELEKKVEQREGRRGREKREWARDRDQRNERFGRFGEDDSGRYSPASRYREEGERPYSRGASRYDQADRDRDRSYRDGDRDRIRNGDGDDDRDRGLSTVTRTPPPPPPPLPANSTGQPAPPPPAPARSPAPMMKNMSPEERQAFIRAEAQRRLEARKQALGVAAPSAASVASSPSLDTTIEDRLVQEKKEAEEKAHEAERQAEEREKQRREKLEAERELKRGQISSPTPTRTAPPPAPAPAPVLPTPTVKTAPPPPKPRAPAPPPPRKGFAARTPAAPSPAQAPSPQVPRAPPAPTPVVRAPVPPAPTPAPPTPLVPEEDPEDAALRAREEALRKKREERTALLRKLEEEEEEARKAEAAYQERRNQFLTAKSSPTIGTTSTVSSSPVPPPPHLLPVSSPVQGEEPGEEVAPPPSPPHPPPPPPAPPASAPVAGDKPSNNPFSRLMKEGGSTPPIATANASSNPFFRAQTAPPAAPPPPKSPGIPPPVKTTYHTAPKDSDDEWDDVMEKEDDDSSDEELGTRDTRMGLAQQLFGNLLPSRPQSAGPAPSSGSPISPAAPPPPPPPPSALSAPIATPAPTGDWSALLGAIQGGARLRKAVTNDRSGAAASGRVIGDTAPPGHINAVARPPSPPTAPALASLTASPPPEPPAALPMGQDVSFGHGKKESVDWYNALAADADKREVDHLPVTVEEDEEELAANAVPSIQVSEHASGGGSELMADVDLSTGTYMCRACALINILTLRSFLEFRVRSLYPYAGQRAEDLGERVSVVVHGSAIQDRTNLQTLIQTRSSLPIHPSLVVIGGTVLQPRMVKLAFSLRPTFRRWSKVRRVTCIF